MMSSHVIAQTAASNDLYIERHSCEIKLYAYNSLICVEIRTYQAILLLLLIWLYFTLRDAAFEVILLPYLSLTTQRYWKPLRSIVAGTESAAVVLPDAGELVQLPPGALYCH